MCVSPAGRCARSASSPTSASGRPRRSANSQPEGFLRQARDGASTPRVPALLAPRSARTTLLARFGREMAGMHLPWGKIAIGGLVAIAAFGGAFWALQWFSPGTKERRPALVEVPPLPPLARSSVIVTPASIALTAIREALEANAPRNLAGKRDNVLPQALSNAEISWTV